LAALLPACEDSVSGFLSCGIDVCSAREVCVAKDAGPECVCAEGFEGANCGTCSSGYRRVNANVCELIPIDCDDDPSVCGSHGSCVDKTSGDVCECDELYAGRLCELCDEGYQDNDSDGSCKATCAQAKLACKSPSRCSDTKGTAVCECPAGYTGDDCSHCALGYRDNGTNCVVTCAAGTMTCSSTQVCVDQPMGARCECATGYAGSSCSSCAAGYHEDPSTGACLPSCESSDIECGEHGRCDDSVGFARCVCELGHAGPECAECADSFEAAVGGACQRTPGDAETLVMFASYQSLSVLATVAPETGATLPLVEVSAAGVASGAEPQTLLLDQAGAIAQLTLPEGSHETLVPGSGVAGPLAWDATQGRLYGIGSKAPYQLVSIDPASKVVVDLYETNLAGVADLAFDATNNRLLALRDTLYSIDLGDGAVTALGELPPATVGIEVASDGTLLALAATDDDEATSRVQACRATAARLDLSGYATATGRFIRPAGSAASARLVEASTEEAPEILSYLGRGAAASPRSVEVQVQNPKAVICLALEEATLIQIDEDATFRALVVYAADADVDFAVENSAADEPSIFLGGYAPSFTYTKRADIVAFTPQEWQSMKLPVDARFHQPGPGVLHSLDATLTVTDSKTLSGAAIPAGGLTLWTPVAP
jgi:hypothetical protein